MMSLSQMLAAKAGGPTAVQPGKPAPMGATVNPYGPKGPTGLPGPIVEPQTPVAPAPMPRRPGAFSMPMGGGYGGPLGAGWQHAAPQFGRPVFGRQMAQ